MGVIHVSELIPSEICYNGHNDKAPPIMNHPTFVKSVLIAKGLGFEAQGFDQLVWDNFVSQFGYVECEKHFAHYINSMIKNGGIDRINSDLRAAPSPNSVRERPIRQSKLAEFEEKVANYLAQFPDDDEVEGQALESESDLLWQAYLALKNGRIDERQVVLDKLEAYFSRVS